MLTAFQSVFPLYPSFTWESQKTWLGFFHQPVLQEKSQSNRNYPIYVLFQSLMFDGDDLAVVLEIDIWNGGFHMNPTAELIL